MSKFVGELICSSRSPGVGSQTIEVSTDEIEAFMLRHFAKGGWDVDFDWPPGQWPKMIVHRKREVQ